MRILASYDNCFRSCFDRVRSGSHQVGVYIPFSPLSQCLMGGMCLMGLEIIPNYSFRFIVIPGKIHSCPVLLKYDHDDGEYK